MSILARLKHWLSGPSNLGSDARALAGSWHVIEIAAPHPFGAYVLELHADGTLTWEAIVPTTDAGDLTVSGSGTWRTQDDTFHYTSGETRGSLQWRCVDERLVLDGLPATKVGPDVRCVLERET